MNLQTNWPGSWPMTAPPVTLDEVIARMGPAADRCRACRDGEHTNPRDGSISCQCSRPTCGCFGLPRRV